MTGDPCMARAVVPRTVAAVNHADTELYSLIIHLNLRSYQIHFPLRHIY